MATPIRCMMYGRYVDLISNGGSKEIDVVEWVMSEEPILCPWIGESIKRHDFDISKADMIFDLLLQEK